MFRARVTEPFFTGCACDACTALGNANRLLKDCQAYQIQIALIIWYLEYGSK